MDQQHAIDRRIGQRQFVLLDQRGQRRPRRRPAHDALRRRHQGEAALGLLAEQAEIGRGIADAQHAQCTGVVPARANAAADEAPGHDAQVLGVEISQVDDIHGDKIACRAGTRRRREPDSVTPALRLTLRNAYFEFITLASGSQLRARIPE